MTMVEISGLPRKTTLRNEVKKNLHEKVIRLNRIKLISLYYVFKERKWVYLYRQSKKIY